MTAGRGPSARTAADAAGLTSADRVVDLGCGPGTSVRHAAHLARKLTAGGLGQAGLHVAKAGHRTPVIVRGVKDPAA
jgi:trans-aconitate methyltransferase